MHLLLGYFVAIFAPLGERGRERKGEKEKEREEEKEKEKREKKKKKRGEDIHLFLSRCPWGRRASGSRKPVVYHPDPFRQRDRSVTPHHTDRFMPLPQRVPVREHGLLGRGPRARAP